MGLLMQQLLAEIPLSSPTTRWAQHILLAFPGDWSNGHNNGRITLSEEMPHSYPISPPVPELVESLTPREVQVLTLLREPVSVREISLKLNISYATTKRHSINLYGKLGVNSRWDAVATAEALGILTPR
ncbi:MAG: hypothetical protein HC804_07400 [Anaerolineae bacterium]|nr:hypothetical protein [Anaerolineae bacterium]